MRAGWTARRCGTEGLLPSVSDWTPYDRQPSTMVLGLQRYCQIARAFRGDTLCRAAEKPGRIGAPYPSRLDLGNEWRCVVSISK
ncbi:hypothetical protein VTK73DRAFT_2552 [Phialemonium thermophilum]|uniref:Uncharacterized protein n=1 Tax=Phialemonium thermophilum TaxID=223376 RepID=A0ABR3VS11_9PEZI